VADNGQYGAAATPVAGWYKDPSNASGLRYWSGTAWTEHVAPAIAATHAPAPAPAPAPARAAESWTPTSASGQSPSPYGAVAPGYNVTAPGYQPAMPGYPAAMPSYQVAPAAPWAQHQGRVPGWDLDAAPLGFGAAIKSAFRNYATFRGRASRSAYWWFALFQGLVELPFIVWYLVAFIASVPIVASSANSTGVYRAQAGILAAIAVPLVVMQLVSLVFLLPSLAAAVRRLHDCDRSGWFYLLSFIPFVGSIVLLIFFVQEGTPGPNQYSLPSPVGGNPSQATWG
jgi:uncharacterized membrane protein YhaH (DUF805 family)